MMRIRFERELDRLENELARGNITRDEFNAEVRGLERDYDTAAQEDAQRAYEERLNEW